MNLLGLEITLLVLILLHEVQVSVTDSTSLRLLEDKVSVLQQLFHVEVRSLRMSLRKEVELRQSLEKRLVELENFTWPIKRENVVCISRNSTSKIQITHNETIPSPSGSDHLDNLARVDVIESELSEMWRHLNKSDCVVELRDVQDRLTILTNAFEHLKASEYRNVDRVQDEIAIMKKTQENQSNLIKDKIDCMDQLIRSSNNAGKRFMTKPFFVSEWILMKSQNVSLCEIYVHHGLGELPLKVDIQVRPISGKYANWIFPATGSAQSDDDDDKPYGGVVYIYNETTVKLFAPNRYNAYYSGNILYTGETHSEWIGEDHLTNHAAFVRVKVWGSSNLPTPEFQSEWLPINIQHKSTSFSSVEHNFHSYPSMVGMQVRLGSSGWVSDGISSTMTRADMSDRQTGGVIYGYNQNSVRVWTPYFNSKDVAKETGRLFNYFDGWGKSRIPDSELKSGQFRISAWAQALLVESKVVDVSSTTLLEGVSAELESDLLWLSLEASDGENQGFRFGGYGGAQNLRTPFGGVIYAYNSEGNFRTWYPNPEREGYLIHIMAPYGTGRLVQASNNASLVLNYVKPKC